ncbi:MAG: GDSL-type esterase/lipase family protein [Taibaiella sp.]|jgi:lysophospholipase L1-like esterase
MSKFDHVVVSAGDSLTQATFSSDYLSILRQRLKGQHYEFVNAGQVGDTSEGLLKRIDKDVLADDPNFITILIGANDARQDIEPKQAIESYRHTIEAIIFKIRDKTNAPVALISIAPLGENPHSSKNKTVEQYNVVLKDMAVKHNLGYLPLFEKLMPALINKVSSDTSDFKLNLATALIKPAFKKYILRKSCDAISTSKGFSILTDGIHINDKAGNILADLIQEWLLSVKQNTPT